MNSIQEHKYKILFTTWSLNRILWTIFTSNRPDFTKSKPAAWQNQQNDMYAQRRQIGLGIHTVWSESSVCAQWVAKDQRFLHANSEDSDQTGLDKTRSAPITTQKTNKQTNKNYIPFTGTVVDTMKLTIFINWHAKSDLSPLIHFQVRQRLIN